VCSGRWTIFEIKAQQCGNESMYSGEMKLSILQRACWDILELGKLRSFALLYHLLLLASQILKSNTVLASIPKYIYGYPVKENTTQYLF
jgi:hypothetical protein